MTGHEPRPYECRTCGPLIVSRFLEAARAVGYLVEVPDWRHACCVTNEAAKACRGLGHDIRVRTAYLNAAEIV